MIRWLCLAAAVTCIAGCDLFEAKQFGMVVTPEEITDAIPLQQCVLLVTIVELEGIGISTLPAHVVAAAPGAAVQVQNPDVRAGEVAEIVVIPAPLADGEEADEEGRDITVTIQAARRGLVATKTVTIHIWSEEEEEVKEAAEEVRDLFIPFLSEEHPEFGIDEDTEWTGTIVTLHNLVVTHYLFFSDEWEMHVYWHVMIPPYNWARIELRRRFEEMLPSEAFEIPSRTADPIEVNEIAPSTTLWR